MQNRKRIYNFTPVKQTVLEESSFLGCDASSGEYFSSHDGTTSQNSIFRGKELILKI
jgi:hypothetical protein